MRTGALLFYDFFVERLYKRRRRRHKARLDSLRNGYSHGYLNHSVTLFAFPVRRLSQVVTGERHRYWTYGRWIRGEDTAVGLKRVRSL